MTMSTTSKDFYCIILKSGMMVRCKSVDDFQQYEDEIVECFLWAKYAYTFNGPVNTTEWFHFHIVDRHGNNTTYKSGRFEVVAFEKDSGCTNFFGRGVTIRDMISDAYYHFVSRLWYNKFIPDEIIPLLGKLNQCDSTDEFQDILKKYSAVEHFQLLKEELSMCKKERDKYKSQIDEIRRVIVNAE